MDMAALQLPLEMLCADAAEKRIPGCNGGGMDLGSVLGSAGTETLLLIDSCDSCPNSGHKARIMQMGTSMVIQSMAPLLTGW